MISRFLFIPYREVRTNLLGRSLYTSRRQYYSSSSAARFLSAKNFSGIYGDGRLANATIDKTEETGGVKEVAGVALV